MIYFVYIADEILHKIIYYFTEERGDFSMKRFVITLGRSCGSGGTTIGKIVAKKLGVSYYNKTVLSLHSDDGSISREVFENVEEEERNTLMYKVSSEIFAGLEDTSPIAPESYDVTQNERLFNYQSMVLKALAKEESYVVVGRCADYVLKDEPDLCLLNVFVSAPTEVCTYKEAGRLYMSSKAAAAHVYKFNHFRDEHYHYFTGRERSDMNNYDLCLNTHYLSYEDCADIIIQALESRMK